MRGPTQRKSYSNAPNSSLKHATWGEHERTHIEEKVLKYSKCAYCSQLLATWRSIWERTQERFHSSAKSVKIASQHKVTWKPMRRSTPEKFYSPAQSVTRAFHHQVTRRHIWDHTGEKPCKCTKCDNCFLRSSSLMEYERSRHTREKSFKCSKCDNSLSIAGHLTEDERPHTGEKLFKCTKCDKRFST